MEKELVSSKGKIAELLKHGFVYGLTSSLQSILGFLILPILTNYFSPETFGVYSLLLLMSAFASSIFYFGASSALGRYYYSVDSEIDRKKIISSAIIITLFGAICLVLISIILSSYFSKILFNTLKYSDVIVLVMVGTALGFILNLFTLIVRYEKKSRLFFFVILAGVIINFSITYTSLTKLNFGIYAPVFGILISNFLCAFALLLNFRNLITLNLNKIYLIQIINFGVQSSFAGLLYYILDLLDRIIIKELLNLTQVGIYSLGYRLGGIINIIVILPFSLIWAPMRMENHRKQNHDSFTTKVVSYYSILGLFIVLFSTLFGENILKIVFTNKDYGESLKIFPIIMFALLFYGSQNIIDFGIYLTNRLYLLNIVAILSIIINLFLNYFLVPIYGYIASAYITLFTYIFSSTLIFLFSKKYYRIRVEWYRVVFPTIFVCTIYAILILQNDLRNSLIFKISIFIIALILFFVIWINKIEKKFLITILSNFKKNEND